MTENLKNLRFAEAISHIIQTAIRYEVDHKDIHNNTIISKVEISKDRQFAKIFIIPSSDDLELNKKEVDAFNKISGFFRKKIVENVKIRAVPKLQFIIDFGYKKGEAVLDLIDKI
ncbi:MAG: 30S ribosome-binding factor RbfA [Spirochaetales bacterium]|jgi:ribosome-binding factor A|nr:30S ribosome-binding factor RbfA [Exilispira sp.]NMC67060.1 30S ribosome-binding factor RbfA [Spirochaetales bacterium]